MSSDLGKVVDKGKKSKDGSDSSDDDIRPAAKAGAGAAAAKRAANSDSSDDDEAERAARKERMAKSREEAEKKKAALEAKREEQEKAALVDGAEIEEEEAPADAPEEASELKRRDEKAKTRFAKTGESLDVNRDGDEDRTRTGELLARNPARIPWIRRQRSVDFIFNKCQMPPEEEEVYMTLASAKKSEKTMAKVREQMRKQGLYVAQERVLLPGNVERAIQRVRARKEHKARKGRQEPASADADAAVVGHVGDPDAFSPEEERYLVPFDPLKERCSRPAMRYDPYLPYLQYSMLVPVTNIDSVFGPARPSRLLDLEIRSLTFIDHKYFCEEDFLAAELSALGRKYKHRAEMKWVDLYTQKIEDVRAALDIVVKERELNPAADAGAAGSKGAPEAKGSAGGKDAKGAEDRVLNKEPELHQELGRLRLLRAAEEFEDLSIVSEMIQVWERIKELREKQEFVSTKVKLTFKKKAMDSRVDQANREEELEAELKEMERLHEHEFNVREVAFLDSKLKLESDIKRRKDRIRQLENKVAQANMAEASDEDASDDDDDEDEGSGAAKGGGHPTREAGKLALKLQKDAEVEKSALETSEKLLEVLLEKQPKRSDYPMDMAAKKEEILKRQRETKRPPGEPLYIPFLSDRAQRTETESLLASATSKEAKDEVLRRKKIKAMKLVMRISVNGHMLRDDDGQVREVKLQQRPGHDFSYTVNESIKLASTSGNPKIVIHICENHGPLYTEELGTLLVPVGEEAGDDRGDPYMFQAVEPYEPDETTRRKDLKKKVKTQEPKEREGPWGLKTVDRGLHFLTGEMVIKVGSLTSLQLEDGSVALNMDSADANAAVQAEGEHGKALGSLMSAPKLKKMIQMNKLDPNDPRNRHLLDLLSANKEQEDSAGFVRFEALADMLRLGGDDRDEIIRFKEKPQERDGKEIVGSRWVGQQDLTRPANVRHKMLLCRQANPALFSNVVSWSPVALVEKEIDDDDMLNKVYCTEFPDAEERDGPSVDDKKVQKVMKFKQKVQEQVRKAKAKHGAKVKRIWRLEDVITQPSLPMFGGGDIIAFFAHLFRKRSALMPESKGTRPQVTSPTSCSISVTIQRAHNLPRRRLPDGAASGTAPKPLECLVEARFDDQAQSTPIARGNDPAWNTRLRLKFEAPGNNWSPSNLLKVAENLHITVFDTKVFETGSSEGRVRKVEKRWLGSVQIPFTTLYTAAAKGRIDGVFALDAPPHIIGYTHVPPKTGKDSKETKDAGPPVPKRPSLQVCVSLDPPLAQPGGGDDQLGATRIAPPALDYRVKEWIRDCGSALHCRHRNYDALARSLHRDWVLATRFVTPQEPPKDAYNKDLSIEKQMLQLARFVGLIPFLDDFQLEGGGDDDMDPDALDVWCTNSEFIDIMAGDWEEHACLLCNFFNKIFHDQKVAMSSYLVFGRGIPEGNTVYTMTIKGGGEGVAPHVEFWNASKGTRYSQNDPHCTLKEIHYVVNHQNVWGNVQQAQEARHTKFDFNVLKDWKPLFTDKFLAANEGKIVMDTVQESIDWKTGQRHDAVQNEVKTFVQNLIKGRMEHWRSREGKGHYDNAAMGKELEKILKKMELASHQEMEYTEDMLHTELDKFLKQNEITGFYINRPYTDIEPIIQEIYNADIHHAGPITGEGGNDRDTQFATAVYVKAFPRRILSLWVAVACCARKRS